MKKEWIKLVIASAFLIVLVVLIFFLNKEDAPQGKLVEEEDLSLYVSKLDDEDDKNEAIVRIHLENSNLLFERVSKQSSETDTTADSTKKIDSDLWTMTLTNEKNERNKYPLNRIEIDSLVETLSDLKAEERIESNTENLESFGLDPAKASYRFWTKNNREYHLLKGNPTPVGNTVYMQKKGSKDIYIVPGFELEILDQGFNEFREKDFLQIEESQLLSIRFQEGTFIRSSKSEVPLFSLPKELKFPEKLLKTIRFQKTKERLTFEGSMSPDQKEQLLGLSEDPEYQNAIEQLFEQSNQDNWTLKTDATKEENLNLEKINTWVNDFLNIRAVSFLDDPKKIPSSSEGLVLELNSETRTIGLKLFPFQGKYYAQIQNQKTLYEVLDHIYQGLDKTLKYFYESTDSPDSNDSTEANEVLEIESEK